MSITDECWWSLMFTLALRALDSDKMTAHAAISATMADELWENGEWL